MKEIRKTKIVCTLGPSTDKGDVLRQLMLEGMNVARFNFSHGSHEEQKARLDKLVELREELGLPVAALLDTKGPEIRLKELEGGKAELKEGQLFTLALGDFVGDASRVAITYEGLHEDVHVGDRILIDDGLIEMKVVRLDGTDIVCEVVNGGMISNKKGVNVPNVELAMPFITISYLVSRTVLISSQLPLQELQMIFSRFVRFWMSMIARASILLQKLRTNRVWITSMRSSVYPTVSW